MTTQQLIEENLRQTLVAWIKKSDVNYRLADDHHGAGWTVDVNDLLKQINVGSIIEQAKLEERERVAKAIYNNAEMAGRTVQGVIPARWLYEKVLEMECHTI